MHVRLRLPRHHYFATALRSKTHTTANTLMMYV